MAELGIEKEYILTFPTLMKVSVLTRIGGFISRRICMTKIGRPLVIKGILQTYEDFVDLARSSQKKISQQLDKKR
jgi:hypothetical protein